MKSTDVFDDLQGALCRKQELLSHYSQATKFLSIKKLFPSFPVNSPYYYKETVETKHGTRFGFWKGHPEYSYHTETRFNYSQFNNDLAAIDLQISKNQTAINNQITEVQNQLASSASKVDANLYELKSYKKVIDDYKAKYHTSWVSINELNSTANQIKAQINRLKEQITQGQTRTELIPSEIAEAKMILAHTQEELACEFIKTDELQSNVAILNDKVSEKIKSLDPEDRAHLLAEQFDKPYAAELIDKIKAIGFNAHHLAYIALEKSHEKLFDLALEYKANCGSYSIDDIGNKTILQHAIALNNKEFVTKILNRKDQDINATLLNALKQDDTLTFEALLNHEHCTKHMEVHGYNYLQYAVIAGNYGLVKKIIDTDASQIKTLSASCDSTFKIALRSGCPEIIDLIAKNINIEQELKSLVERKDYALIDRALESEHVTFEIKQSLFREVVRSHDKQTIKSFTDHQADFTALFKTAVATNDLNLIYDLADTDRAIFAQDVAHEMTLSGNPDMSLLLANIALTFESDIV